MAQHAEIIVVRHGESDYSGAYPDLTEEGKSQIIRTAQELSSHVLGFDEVIALSSPDIRARGSADLFVETLGLDKSSVRTARSLRAFDIFNLPRFIEHMDQHSTAIYGEAWLTNPLLATANDFVESREHVDQRARRALYHYAHSLQKRGVQDKDKTICIVAFTHFEVGNTYLKGLLSEDVFPIGKHPVLQNGEYLKIAIVDAEKGEFVLEARGRRRRAILNYESGEFRRIHRR